MNEHKRFKLAIGLCIGSVIVGLLKVAFKTYPIMEVFGILTLIGGSYFTAQTWTDNVKIKNNPPA
jgi:hypothetical protein